MDNALQKAAYSIKRLQSAAKRLADALGEQESDLKADATIQRFEFTFELVWKTLKRVFHYEGELCSTPRECLKTAYRIGLLEEEEPWLSMLDDRNVMAHVYDEQTALDIYKRIADYEPAITRLVNDLIMRYVSPEAE